MRRVLRAAHLDPRTRAGEWKSIVTVGAVLIVLGFAAIVFPFAAALAAEVIIGAVLLLGGLAEVIAALRRRPWSAFLLMFLGGLAAIVAGALLLAFPLAGVVSLALVVGVFFLVQGAVRIALAWRERGTHGWGWWLAGGVLAVLLGVLILLVWPAIAPWLLGVLVGVDLIVSGWRNVAVALTTRARTPASA